MEEVRVPLWQRSVGLSDTLHGLHRRGLAYVSENKLWILSSHPHKIALVWIVNVALNVYLITTGSSLWIYAFLILKGAESWEWWEPLLIGVIVLMFVTHGLNGDNIIQNLCRGLKDFYFSGGSAAELSCLRLNYRNLFERCHQGSGHKWLTSAAVVQSGCYYHHQSSLSRMFDGWSWLFFSLAALTCRWMLNEKKVWWGLSYPLKTTVP